MRRPLAALALPAALALTVAGGSASAQPPGFGRPRNPSVSPYLSLLNSNNSMAFNYYELYRPQREFRQAYQGLNREIYRSDRQIEGQIRRLNTEIEQVAERVRPGASLGTTGHKTTFMSYGNYFPSQQQPTR